MWVFLLVKKFEAVCEKFLGCASAAAPQVLPLTQFFLFPFCEKIIDLPGRQINDPAYSSDSNKQPVALISNITLIPPSTRSKNDTIASIYTSTQ